MGRHANPAIDWQTIEGEYRAGQLPVREIARQHGVSHVAIGKRAAADGWERDLTQEIRKKVTRKLVTSEVTKDRARDEEIIEAAADRGVAVIQLHRQDIQRLRTLEQVIMDDLEDKPTKLYITQYQGEIVEKEVGLCVTERAGALRDLATVQHKRIQLERQAFNLDDRDQDTGTPKSIMSLVVAVCNQQRVGGDPLGRERETALIHASGKMMI